MKPRTPVMVRAQGFTLIEILICLAIISLLAAILFPVFGRARENARRTACLSNMKQIGMGMLQYLQDYDETYPRHRDNTFYFNSVTEKDPDSKWFAGSGNSVQGSPDPRAEANFLFVVRPYIKGSSVYTCPSVVDIPASGGCAGGVNANPCYTATKTNSTSYVINGVIVRQSGPSTSADGQRALKVAAVPNIAEIAILQEFKWKINAALNRPRWDGNSSPSAGRYQLWHTVGGFGAAGVENVSNNHFAGGNILFCDGHAKWRLYTSLKSADFGLRNCDSGDDWGSATYSTNCKAFDQQ